MATIPQIITDKNGHQKTVHINPDKGVGKLVASTGTRSLPSTPPPSPQGIEFTSDDIQRWAVRNNLPLSNDDELMDLVNAAATYRGDLSDEGLAAAYHQTFSDNFGGYSVDSLRAALSVKESSNLAILPNNTQPTLSVDALDGLLNGVDGFDQLPDKLTFDGQVFGSLDDSQKRPGHLPSDLLIVTPNLTVDEANQFIDQVRYAWVAEMHSRNELPVRRVGDHVFAISTEGNMTPNSHVTASLEQFEDIVAEYYSEGTPLRQDNTRAVEPIHKDGIPGFAFYYDLSGERESYR